MANEDMKKDKIKMFNHGLKLPSKKNKEIISLTSIDSLHNKYGLYESSTCIVSEELKEAEKRYKEITNEYLITRNGKNWEQKMKIKIDSILNK